MLIEEVKVGQDVLISGQGCPGSGLAGVVLGRTSAYVVVGFPDGPLDVYRPQDLVSTSTVQGESRWRVVSDQSGLDACVTEGDWPEIQGEGDFVIPDRSIPTLRVSGDKRVMLL